MFKNAQYRKMLLFFWGIPKTIIFNFKYFPLAVAWKLPVFISHRVYFKSLQGEVTLAVCKTGSIKIGFGEVGIFDEKQSRTVWQVSGKVHFDGKTNIGHGSKISVIGKLSFGDGVTLTAESTIVAHENIQIGRDVLISWDTLIMDTDLHCIYDKDTGLHINPSKPVVIGDSVWIGCRVMILKGVTIVEGNIIGAGSIVTKSLKKKSSVYAGVPASLMKENVSWRR